MFIFCVTNLTVSAFGEVLFFKEQQWNWMGKGLALVFNVAFIAVVPGVSRNSSGLNASIKFVEANALFILCSIYFLLRIGLYLFSGEATQSLDAETILYQATLPGLQEELLYRGILPGLLTGTFMQPKFQFLKVDVGLGVVITSILFGLSHALHVDAGFAIRINPFAFGRTLFDGFLFALLAEKTKSIFPAVMYHNALNLIGSH